MVFLDQLYWVPPDNADRPKVEAMAEALREKGTMVSDNHTRSDADGGISTVDMEAMAEVLREKGPW